MNETKYVFWIETKDENDHITEVRWSNLTKRQAMSMHKWTEDCVHWGTVKAYGWEEQK